VKSDDAANDLVAMEWYVARDEMGQPRHAPAVVVVHETGSDMIAGRLFARSLCVKGVHALMVQLPFYGARHGGGRPPQADMVTLFRQGVADIRRARDAVAVLPDIDTDNVSLQGTSLGGFAAAIAGSLDGAFDRTFLTLAGGNLHELILNDHRETRGFRRRLNQQGVADDQLETFFWQIEPLRIAHRLDPATTWLYSATDDQVVPTRHSTALADAAHLSAEHRLEYPGNHYTVFVYFPKMLDHMVGQITTPVE
jgi:dienelactone hydrolase